MCLPSVDHETREWDWVAYLGVVVGSKVGVCDVAPELEVRDLFVEVPRLDLGYLVPKIEVNSHDVNAVTTPPSASGKPDTNSTFSSRGPSGDHVQCTTGYARKTFSSWLTTTGTR